MSDRFHLVGGTTFDLLAHDLPTLPRLDEAGDEFTPTSLVHLPAPFVPSVGGNAGNAAFVAARLGRDTRLVTALGDDLFGSWVRERLAAAGVDLAVVPPPETSVNVVATDTGGRRHSLFRPVRADTAAVTAAAAQARIDAGDVVLLGGYPHPEPSAVTAWARVARGRGARVALDVGPGVAGLTAEMLADALPSVDVLLASHLELDVLVPDVEPPEAARRLARQFDLAVVVKAGVDGATSVTDDGPLHVPAFRTRAAGPTVGAGDAFNAGFLCRSQEGAPPEEALRFGAAVAALVVERARGVAGAPDRAEVDAYLAEGAAHFADPAADPGPHRPTGNDDPLSEHATGTKE